MADLKMWVRYGISILLLLTSSYRTLSEYEFGLPVNLKVIQLSLNTLSLLSSPSSCHLRPLTSKLNTSPCKSDLSHSDVEFTGEDGLLMRRSTSQLIMIYGFTAKSAVAMAMTRLPACVCSVCKWFKTFIGYLIETFLANLHIYK